MRAAIIDKPNEIRVGDVPDPTPGPGEVVVKVGACGICGSDLNIAAGNFPPTPFPIVPGHEFAGEVVAVGTGVDYVTEGERVAVDPTLICGHCKWCRWAEATYATTGARPETRLTEPSPNTSPCRHTTVTRSPRA